MNDKEAKSQEQRLGWAIFLSILFHIFLIFLGAHLKNDVPKEENRVMTVRLVQEHLSVSQEKSGNNKATSSKKENAPTKKQVIPEKKIISPKNIKQKTSAANSKPDIKNQSVQKNYKTIEKTEVSSTPSKSPIKEEIVQQQEKSQPSENVKVPENTPVTIENDIVAKLENQQIEEKLKLENDFFNDNQSSAEILPDFDFSEALFAENLSSLSPENNDKDSKSKNENATNNNATNGKDIEWNGGGARGLLFSDAIEVPEDIKKAGLKFVIEINFDVDSNGYIRNANIVKSSGNSMWDEDIRRQFCKWVFEKSTKQEYSLGKILITIGY
ncbi:MAG: energy transducer TonB [Spirochaetales bacterium]|nr:energy transducer TonB [Spirochaetales bacterium]